MSLSRAIRPLIGVCARSSLISNIRSIGFLPSSSVVLRHPLLSGSHFKPQPFSTKVAENPLSDFLKNEIEAEKQLARKYVGGGEVPTIPGFTMKTNEADVTLTKSHNSEKITITFNVNQTVEPDLADLEGKDQQQDAPESPRMTSRPDFDVEIAKGSTKLCFGCTFVEPHLEESAPDAEMEHDDLFMIREVFVVSGASAETAYSSTGDMMDGNLYDHLMDYLAERGIDEKFADNLVKFSTHYEHAQYVALLSKIREFVAAK